MLDIDQVDMTPLPNSIENAKCIQSIQQEAGKYDVSTHVKAGKSLTDDDLHPSSFDAELYEHVVMPVV